MILKGHVFSDLALAEAGGNATRTIQILKTGKFDHPDYGTFEITPQTLAEMKKNFDENIRRQDLPVDYYHESDKAAAGWFKELELKDSGGSLWATVDFTPRAAKMLNDRELRYFSPDFTFQWKDPETGDVFDNVLFGGGLTNRPFLKDMAPVALSEKSNKSEGGFKMKEKLEQLEAENLKLQEEMKQYADGAGQVEALKKQIADLQEQLAKLEGDNQVVMAEKVKLEEEKKIADEARKLAEKEAAFNVLLTEGKACVAQKDAFITDDMASFIKLAQPLNLKGKGTVEGDSDNRTDEEKIIELAEKKRELDPRLELGHAISLVKKELKK